MYIWIDESYDSKFPGHIVVGALILHANSKEIVDQSYNTLLKRIKNHNRNCKSGQKISCPEIHENILYNKGKQYRQIKYWAFGYLKDSSTSNNLETKAVYTSIPLGERGTMSDDVYFSMVSDLVSHCISLCNLNSETTYIIMDNMFDNKQRAWFLQKFKENFPSHIYRFSFADSVVEKGLQFADLVTGTIRRHLNSDENDARAYEQLQDYFSLTVLQAK